MLSFVIWYLTLTILGLLTFPLSYRLFSGLTDRGYAFSRILGLLLWGYLFWLLASLGVLRNDLGGILFALLLLLGLSAWSLLSGVSGDGSVFDKSRDRLIEIADWLRMKKTFILFVEVLFLIGFGGYALVRAANPEIFGTEKPMEIAFINAILRSPTFPPHDPWLSGYSISYYYFGYILVAMLAQLTRIPGAVAFNLGLALIYGLSMLGSYGLVFNLLNARRAGSSRSNGEPTGTDRIAFKSNALYALFGPLFILITSNIEGFLEVLHARGLLPAAFWSWLDIQDINQPPIPPFSWLPRLYGTGSWWWWRASRVVQDYDFQNNSKEIIDEFPVFSFLLGDLHPHVLAIPFAFLAMVFSLNILLSKKPQPLEWFHREVSDRLLAWVSVVLIGLGVVILWFGLGNLRVSLSLVGLLAMLVGGFIYVGIPSSQRQKGLKLFSDPDSGIKKIGLSLYMEPADLFFGAVIFGGLAFLNTWDFPFYVVLFAGAYVIRRIWAREVNSFQVILMDFVGIGILIGLLGVLFYLPFYIGFSSQAGGIIPNLIYPTRGAHLWVMFLTFLVPIAVFLLYLWKRNGDAQALRRGFGIVILMLVVLWILSVLFGLAIQAIPGLSDLFLSSLAAPSFGALAQQALLRRVANAGGWITLALILGVTLALLWPRRQSIEDTYSFLPKLSLGFLFSLALVLLSALLVIGPEFFYLRDQFGWRINTIFKFYYQAWLLWGIVAAYGTVILLHQLNGVVKYIFQVVIVLLIGFGLVYTLLGFWDKTQGFNPPDGWTLDGSVHIERQSPDEREAIRWMESAPLGVVSEAVGGSYTGYARVSAFSGAPTVLGWPGHESQWRGGSNEIGSRQHDIQRLYCARDWLEAQEIIDQYNIRYIYIGGLERSTYTSELCGTGLNEAKFRQFLKPVFKQGDVIIYETQ